MQVIYLLLLAGATVCFFIAAFGGARATSVNERRPVARVNLIALGLLLWVLVPLLQTFLAVTGL